MIRIALAAAATALLAAAPASKTPPQAAPQAATPAPIAEIAYQVTATYPHDTAAFTEGLFFRNGSLFESTGLEGQSEIRQVRIADGKPIRSVKIPPGIFGEGIVDWGDQIVSVTWHQQRGFRWSLPGLKQVGSVRYSGEGWGMTRNADSIILSDGTPDLRFMDPKSFAVRRTLRVTANGRPLHDINELEWIDGAIYANVWMTQWIVRIDPATGIVTGAIDLAPLVQKAGGDYEEKTPNGIAWDAKTRTLYVTGKKWPFLFALKIDAPATQP